ncbi:MAG TPA: toll/interleukin-1 receptor domain-containing protein [Alphaproteobacteria bacterium]|jgi:hypothetical protein|nr:toll/interleukin-1 receptor domain-containing protein [Alphaproteobacteria bacterium]
MSYDVFISYSTKDKITADAVCGTLEASGIRCWIAPRDIGPGREWGEAIIDAIESCQVMVLVFSAHANDSPQIRREIERAVNKSVAILTLRIEDIMPARSLEYFLGSLHWLDALPPPVEQHLYRLVTAVQSLLPAPADPIESGTTVRHLSSAHSHDAEIVFWESVKDSKDRADFQEYLKAFPEGRFAGLARHRLAAPTPRQPDENPPRAEIPPTAPPVATPPMVEQQAFARRSDTQAPSRFAKAIALGVMVLAVVAGILFFVLPRNQAAPTSAPPDAASSAAVIGPVDQTGQSPSQKNEVARVAPKKLPPLPFELDAASIHIIETSDAFQNWPEISSDPITVQYKTSDTPDVADAEWSEDISSTDNFIRLHKFNSISRYYGVPDYQIHLLIVQQFSMFGGLVRFDLDRELGQKDCHVKDVCERTSLPTTAKVKTAIPFHYIREINGSLFPFQKGKSFSITTDDSAGNSGGGIVNKIKCIAGDRFLASNISSLFSGYADRVDCVTTLISGSSTTYDRMHMAYIENIGLFSSNLSAITINNDIKLPESGSNDNSITYRTADPDEKGKISKSVKYEYYNIHYR